jgi:predicted amidohydrolase
MADRLLIAVAQLNCTVGDLAGNAARILDYAGRAQAAGADLVLTPEFSLCGYPPEDLVLREGFLVDCRRELERLAARLRGPALVDGVPELAADGRRYNAAALIRDGRIAAVARKRELPNYDVFDEKRYFDAGDAPCVLDVKGVRWSCAASKWPSRPFAKWTPSCAFCRARATAIASRRAHTSSSSRGARLPSCKASASR